MDILGACEPWMRNMYRPPKKHFKNIILVTFIKY